MTGIGPFGPPPPTTVTPSLLGNPNQFASPIGPPAAPAAAADPSGLETAGGIAMVAGVFTSAVGAFYAAKTQQNQLESEALNREFQETIANINARSAESDASAILRAGRQERALSTLRFGAVKGERRARLGARGIQAGVGSAAEELASVQFASDVDSHSIDINTLRAAQAARRRAVNFRNVADIAGVNARNARRSRRSINPALSAGTSLLTGGAGAALFLGGL